MTLEGHSQDLPRFTCPEFPARMLRAREILGAFERAATLARASHPPPATRRSTYASPRFTFAILFRGNRNSPILARTLLRVLVFLRFSETRISSGRAISTSRGGDGGDAEGRNRLERWKGKRVPALFANHVSRVYVRRVVDSGGEHKWSGNDPSRIKRARSLARRGCLCSVSGITEVVMPRNAVVTRLIYTGWL